MTQKEQGDGGSGGGSSTNQAPIPSKDVEQKKADKRKTKKITTFDNMKEKNAQQEKNRDKAVNALEQHGKWQDKMKDERQKTNEPEGRGR